MNAQQIVLVREAGSLGVGNGNESRVSSFAIDEKLAFTFLPSIQGTGHLSQPATYAPDYCSPTVCKQENERPARDRYYSQLESLTLSLPPSTPIYAEQTK